MLRLSQRRRGQIARPNVLEVLSEISTSCRLPQNYVGDRDRLGIAPMGGDLCCLARIPYHGDGVLVFMVNLRCQSRGSSRQLSCATMLCLVSVGCADGQTSQTHPRTSNTNDPRGGLYSSLDREEGCEVEIPSVDFKDVTQRYLRLKVLKVGRSPAENLA
jgi:hypothetical protein